MRPVTPAIRDLARRLLEQESGAGGPSGDVLAVSRAIDRLRVPLTTLVGPHGTQALLSRALVLAKEEADWLGAVTVTPEGSLAGFEVVARARDPAARFRGEIALLSRLLALLVDFIGENFTIALVLNACSKPGDVTQLPKEDSK